jgi:hypothetical protein
LTETLAKLGIIARGVQAAQGVGSALNGVEAARNGDMLGVFNGVLGAVAGRLGAAGLGATRSNMLTA